MDAVLRALVIYLFLMLLFRISGQRSLGQITTFDFVLLLVIGEATQQALLGDDFSLINAMIVITTLVTIDIGLALWGKRSSRLDKLIEGTPLVLVEDGEVFYDRMAKVQVGVDEIRQAAREMHGLERLSQVKYAVLERSGGISIIPRQSE
jgi:uncharacterized membrane protein YcaP (DUF421 family)